MKLTPKLAFVFVLFAAVVLVGANVFGFKRSQEALKAITITELEAIAGEKEAAVQDWILARQARVEALASSPTLRKELATYIEFGSAAKFSYDRLLLELTARTGPGQSFLNLFILSAENGQVLVSVDPDEKGKSNAEQAYFVEGEKAIYTTSIYYSPDLNAPAMTTIAPLLSDDGELLGVLVARLKLEEVNAIIQRRSGLRETDDAFLVNRSRLAVTQPRFLLDPAVLKQEIHTVPVDRCLKQENGTVLANDYQNVPVIAAYRWLPEQEMCLIVKISQAEVLAPIIDFRNEMVWLVLGALAVASIVALALSRTIIQPILSMQVAAQRYGRGDLDVHLPESRQDELGMLARDFNRMASALSEKENQVRAHSLELERRVAERTAELTQSEQRYRFLFENMLSGYAYCEMIFDQGQPHDFIYVNVNKAFESLTGLKEVVGKKVSEVIPGIRESNPELFEVYGRVSQTGESEELETYVKPLDLWFSIAVYSPRLNDFVAVFDNITERKQTEKVLRESEELLKKSQAISHVGSWELDHSSSRLIWSDEVFRIFGFGIQEFTPTYEIFLEAIHPDDRAAIDEAFSRSIREGHNTHEVVEHRIVRPESGEVRFVHGKCEHIKDASGRIIRSIGMVEDITEQKQAETAILAMQKRFQALIENAPDGIALLGLDGKLQQVTPSTQQILGYSSEDAQGQDPGLLTHPDDLPALLTLLNDLIQNPGMVSRIQYRFKHKDGSWRWLESTISNLIGEPGVEAIVFNYRDITDRKQAEEALREKESLLSEAQRIGHIGSWRYDISSDTMKFSDAMYPLLDVQPQEFRHNREDFLALVYPSDRLMAAQWFTDMKEATQSRDLDFRIFHKNGELCYLHCTGAVEFDVAATPARFIGTAQDVTERRVAEIQIDQQIKRLTALSEIDRAIISSFDQRYTLGVILSHIISQLQVDAADVLLLDSERNVLTYAASHGFLTRRLESVQVRMGESHAGRAAKERRMIRILDLRDTMEVAEFDTFVAAEGFVSYIGVPLIVKGNVKGVLEVYQRSTLQPYPEWLDFFNTLVGQTAIAIENTSLFENLRATNQELIQAYDATIEGWSRAMDLRDRETAGHTQRVTKMTLELAQALGMDAARRIHIRRGALLHDIGKLGVPDHILFKPDKLTGEEKTLIERHVDFAYEMLAPIPYLKPALNIPYFHHEKWDGTGYPLGLKGEQIPLEARIFAVVDVWDALLSDRPYRAAWTRDETVEYIRAQTGIHFDPRVVECFLEILKKLDYDNVRS